MECLILETLLCSNGVEIRLALSGSVRFMLEQESGNISVGEKVGRRARRPRKDYQKEKEGKLLKSLSDRVI